jgi:hypothetical protein
MERRENGEPRFTWEVEGEGKLGLTGTFPAISLLYSVVETNG